MCVWGGGILHVSHGLERVTLAPPSSISAVADHDSHKRLTYDIIIMSCVTKAR